MPSRRFHPKRRHGCKQCKARRVKCDARAPCQYCMRRQEPCSNNAHLLDKAAITTFLPSATPPFLASPLKIQRLSPAETEISLLGISHLELSLLDHYCNVVAPIISPHDHLRHMWQYEIPHQAKIHPFLMHCILSASAYHLCYGYVKPPQRQQERPSGVLSTSGESNLMLPFHSVPAGHIEWQIQQSNRLERFALEQQRIAFQTYIPSLRELNTHNQEALCAASALLSLSALASTRNHFCLPILQPQYSSPIDDWLEISVLVRGVNAIVQNAATSIMDGALQPLLRHLRIEATGDGPVDDVHSQVRQLLSPQVLSALDALSPAIDQIEYDEADKKILHKALGFLKISFAVVEINPGHEGIVMVWSNLLDEEFFPFVRRREPIALILLAYWTVAFGKFKDRWWVGGLDTTMLRHIVEILTPLHEREEATDEHVQVDRPLLHDLLERDLDHTNDPRASQAKWRHHLEWPLRESEISDQ